MTLRGLGTRDERGAGIPILGLFSSALLLLGIILLGRQLVDYSSRDLNALQSDVIIAGVQVGGLSASEAQARWEGVYLDQAVTVVYRDIPIQFYPRSLGMRINNEAMLAQARAQSAAETNFWSGFWAHLWNRSPDPVRVQLDASVQEGQMRAILEDIAARYNSGPGDIGFDQNTLTFLTGAAGSRLDIEGAIDIITAALFSPNPAERTVILPTQGVTASDASMDDLRTAILDYISSQGVLYDGVTTLVSVFVMDLKTGEELSILGDVAHSGVSTIKIPLLINYFRYHVTAPDPDTTYLMASAIICSHNPGANYIIQMTSDTKTNMIEGLQRASQTMLEIGAINSWITSPLFVGRDGEYPIIAAPRRANLPNQDYNAQPDPLNQTTAEDMGTVMALLYDCAFHGGGLMAIYREEITQDECQQILELLSGVKFWRFSELGAPEGTRIAHKVGYGAETVGDVAIVFSPATDYIFVMYVWEEDLDNDFITELDKWDLIDEVARLTYNYFNPAQALTEARPPANPLGGAGCVLPKTSEEVSLSDINAGRFDAGGNPLPSACYDWPNCRPFDNWGRGE